MSDTITLPREVVKFVLQHLEWWSDDEPQEKEAITALRTALAAEQPKPEPVAWRPRLSPNLCFHWSRPWNEGVPSEQTVDYWNQKGAGVEYAYAAPPATHPGYVIGSHWLETAYSRICAGEAEADVLRDIGLVREEAFLTGVAHLKAENERLRGLLTEARGAKWLVVQDNLLDRIDAALRREDV